MVLRDTMRSRAISGPFNSDLSSLSTSSSCSLSGSINIDFRLLNLDYVGVQRSASVSDCGMAILCKGGQEFICDTKSVRHFGSAISFRSTI